MPAVALAPTEMHHDFVLVGGIVPPLARFALALCDFGFMDDELILILLVLLSDRVQQVVAGHAGRVVALGLPFEGGPFGAGHDISDYRSAHELAQQESVFMTAISQDAS